MRKLPSKEQIVEMISWSWMAFFFLMSWVCVGIVSYGVIFQWIFAALLPEFNTYHLPVFVLLWIFVPGIYYLTKKQKP